MQIYANNATSTLAAPVAPGATALTLAAGDGGKFPSPANGDFFLATLASGSPESKWEVVKVTARAGDGLTIVKAQEGTADQAWNQGDKVELRLTANTLANISADMQGVGMQANELAQSADTNDLIFYPRRRAKPGFFMAGGAQPMRPWSLQTGFDSCRPAVIMGFVGTSNPQCLGTNISTPSGTLSSYTPAATDIVATQQGQTFTGAAAANSVSGISESSSFRKLRGDAALKGGFLFYTRFVLVTIDAAGAGKNRAIFGLTQNAGNTGILDVGNPSAFGNNLLGLGFDDTDANVQLIFHTSGATTKIDTGQPRNTANQMWELWLFSEPNGSVIYAHADLWIGNTRSNVVNNQAVSSNIPAATGFLFGNWLTGTGSGPGAQPVHRFCHAYMESYP